MLKSYLPEEEAIKGVIDNIWDKYDDDKSGALDRDETKKFVQDTLGNLGSGDGFDQVTFDKVFEKFDKDNSGTVEKDEMVFIIKEILEGKYGRSVSKGDVSPSKRGEDFESDKMANSMLQKFGKNIKKSYASQLYHYTKKGITHWVRDKDEIVEPGAHLLHFQGDSKQKTFVGGLASMLVTAYLLFMVYTNGRKMIYKGDNSITSLME
jgi:Ca2+-binding EF-hand superfamily protein